MEKSQLEWGDLLYLHALANNKTLSGAAESLEVNRTTVSRRLDNLEQALGVKLVAKSGRDLVLTEVGQLALKSAEAMHEQVTGLKREIRNRDESYEGMVRITTTPRLCGLIEPALSRLMLEHPEMRIELSASMEAEDGS